MAIGPLPFGNVAMGAGSTYLLGYDPGLDSPRAPDLNLYAMPNDFSMSGSRPIGLTNSGEFLLLYDPSAVPVDGLQWGPPTATNSDPTAAGFANLATDGIMDATQSLARDLDGVGNWGIASPTPGLSNSAAVPEPSPWLLLGTIRYRRRKLLAGEAPHCENGAQHV